MEGNDQPNRENDLTQAEQATPAPREQQPTGGPEKVSVKIERGTHKDAKDQQKDNVELLRALNGINEQDRQKNIEQARQWQNQGNLDLMRAAGLSLEELQKNPLERHIRLCSTFLHSEKSTSGLVYRVDYSGVEMAAWDLDLADMLPPNILSVDILNDKNQIIYKGAVRGFDDGRPGYFDPVTKQRVTVQNEQKIRINETQSSLAIKDRVFGEQTNQHAVKEEMYLVENAQKTVIKEEAKKQAARQNLDLQTNDKSFFDVFLANITQIINGEGATKDGNPLKIDFSGDKIQTELKKLLASFGFSKLLPDQTKTTTPSGTGKSPESVPEPATNPGSGPARTPAAAGQKRESIESRNAPRINQEWLLANVGRNNAEVQRWMVPITFMGARVRVNKLMAAYLCEAEERMSAAGVKYEVKQNQISCQNWRPIRGGTSLSNHSWGTAIDINSIENPWQPNLRGNPANKNRVITTMPPEFVAIMEDVGLKQLWWDPMHFELVVNPYKNTGVLRSEKARQLAANYLA